MRNINELIGIIKGINFDGIINDKEVECLQSWVNKNRNLAYEPKEIELIRLVDSAIEDHIISNEERELIVSHSNTFLKNVDDDSAKIYELNGIIEGVVCDGKVNEAEIIRLKKWMDTYGEHIRAHKPSADLCRVIDGILNDGIVTIAEQQELLEILSGRIDNSQFETKLAYLCRQVKAKKNIGIDLIDILDNHKAMDEIHQRAEEQLYLALCSYTGVSIKESEVVFVSLCLIGMLEYDGSFYGGVRKTYVDLYRRFPAQKIEGVIRTLLNRYRTEEERNTNSKSRIINTVLSNTIVPSHYLAAFFEFLYDIYKLNFEYDLVDDLYDEFKFIYEGLRSSMMSEGDDIQDNVTKKTYKLIKTTKQLIASGKNLDSVIKLSIIVVKLIDKHICNKSVEIYNPYLKIGFDKWSANIRNDVVSSGGKKVSEWRSRWEPKYLLEGNDIYLVPPVHKVKAEYNYWDIFVQVLNDGKVIFENKDPDIKEIIAGYKVCAEKIKLNEPLKNVSYRLMAGNKVIYDSKVKLYRKFIVFDKNGLEIQNNTDYKGTAVFCYKTEHQKFSPFYASNGYKLASRNIKYSDSYCIENIVFNFSALIKPGIFGIDYDKVYLINETNGDKLKVFKEVRFLVFESENCSNKFEILINGRAYKMSDFSCTTTEREGVCKHVIELTIYQPGIYSVIINQIIAGNKNKIAVFRFALDPDYNAVLEKLDESIFVFEIASALSEKNTICGKIELESFNENFAVVEHKGNRYYYLIPFDLEAYRISKSVWKPLSDEMWIGDISNDSELDIYDTEVDEMIVYSSRGQLLDTVQMKDKGIYRQVGIGFLISYKEEYEYVLLVFLKEGKTKRAMFCNNKCIMRDETEISFDSLSRVLKINPWFYGNGKVYCEIYDSNEESVYVSEIIENNSLFEVTNLKSYEKYTIVFFEKTKGLMLKKNREMKRFDRVFYAREDLVGKEFKIAEVCYMNDEQSVLQELALSKSYLHFLNKIADDKFVGEIYKRDANSQLRSNLIKPVEIEMCSEVINESIELVITKRSKNLTLDIVRNHVSDSPMNKGSEVEAYTVIIN